MAEKERADERRGVFSQHARQIQGGPPDRRDRRKRTLLKSELVDENKRLLDALEEIEGLLNDQSYPDDVIIVTSLSIARRAIRGDGE